MKLTIAVITAREDPQLGHLLDSLEPQLQTGDEIDLVVVDALHPRPLAGLRIPAACTLRRVPPKPCAWQGENRITPRDYFANANARNTAICYARHDYVAFLDDRVELGARWLSAVREGERSRSSVLCGPYDKHTDQGLSIDHRRQLQPQGLRNCGGTWAYGGNFTLPLEWLLEVNGCEEGCDPTGLEDCTLGFMLAAQGRRIDFVAEMAVEQDRHGDVHPLDFPRIDKGPSPRDRSHGIRERFWNRRRTEFTPPLRGIRQRVLAGVPAPFPWPDPEQRDWWDGCLLKEFVP